MTRATDLHIIATYRAVSTELLECLHAATEMLERIGHVLPMGKAQEAFDIGMDDLQTQLYAIGDRMKQIHAAATENVRITMHGGEE